MVGWGVVCAESVDVLEKDMDSTNLVDKLVDCLDNLRVLYRGFKGIEEVTRVVVFFKHVVFRDGEVSFFGEIVISW